MKNWFVYIIECKNKTLYTGITNNLKRRLRDHGSGKGCNYTRSFGFSKLVWKEKQPDRSLASKREQEIKRWTRKKKLGLIKKTSKK